MSLKTLDNFLEEGVELFPANVDTLTKVTIEDWFGYRKVANNKMFPGWFWRCLVMNYPRYMELLRIEARTAGSEYDWLVTNYEERQVETTGSEQGTLNETGTSNQTNNRRFTAGTNTVIIDSSTDNTDGSVTNEHTGTDTNVNTQNLAHGETIGDQNQTSGTDNATRTPNLTTQISVSDETSESVESETVRTPDLSSVSKSSETDSSRHGVLQRQAPYDQDYAGLTANTNANIAHGVGGSGVDSGTVEVLNNSASMAGFPALVIQNPTASSDELTQNANVSYNSNEQTGRETTGTTSGTSSETDRSETKTETGAETNNRTTSRSESNTRTINGTNTGTDTDQRTLNLTDEETTDLTVEHSGRSETRHSGTDIDNVTITRGNTKQGSNSRNTTGLERTIFTGRSGQSPQLLLADAVEFIKQTSAWKFLYRKLSPCFMMAFDTDDYEED